MSQTAPILSRFPFLLSLDRVSLFFHQYFTHFGLGRVPGIPFEIPPHVSKVFAHGKVNNDLIDGSHTIDPVPW